VSETLGYLVIPYRVLFDANGIVGWLRKGWPILWHYWAEATDLQRIPFDRRRNILAYRFRHYSSGLDLPTNRLAVRWWVSRLLSGPHWAWDRGFTSNIARTHVGGIDPAKLADGALRRPVREFVTPRPFCDFLDREELRAIDGDHVYVPPTNTYHLRYRPFTYGWPGWLGANADDRIAVRYTALRLHPFRFGDGWLTLEYRTEEADVYKRIVGWLDDPHQLRLGFDGKEDEDEQPLPWTDGRIVRPVELVRQVLTPQQTYDDGPDNERWHFVDDENVHTPTHPYRIELPLGSRQLPMLLLPTNPEEGAERRSDGIASLDGTLAQRDALTHPTIAAGDDDDEREERLKVRGQHAETVFGLALMRRVALEDIGDRLAMPDGTNGLNSAQELSDARFTLGIARDRFLSGSPVLGGPLTALWKACETSWESPEQEARVSKVVEAYGDSFFRDRAMRLIARVTSTFWFLFRWIILSLMAAPLLAAAAVAALIGVGAILTLRLLATVVIIISTWLLRRQGETIEDADSDDEDVIDAEAIDDEEEQPPAKDGEARDRSMKVLRTRIRRKPRSRRRLLYIVSFVEVVVLAVLMVVWQEFRERFTDALPFIGGAVAVGIAIVGIGIRKRERRSKILRMLRRETFPTLGAGLAGLILLGLIGWGLAVLATNLSAFLIPKFWGEVVPDPTSAPENPGEGTDTDDD